MEVPEITFMEKVSQVIALSWDAKLELPVLYSSGGWTQSDLGAERFCLFLECLHWSLGHGRLIIVQFVTTDPPKLLYVC